MLANRFHGESNALLSCIWLLYSIKFRDQMIAHIFAKINADILSDHEKPVLGNFNDTRVKDNLYREHQL